MISLRGVALTIGFFMNLHGVLTAGTTGLLPLGEPLWSPAGILISISLHMAVFLFAIWSLRPSASFVATTDPEIHKNIASQPPT